MEHAATFDLPDITCFITLVVADRRRTIIQNLCEYLEIYTIHNL